MHSRAEEEELKIDGALSSECDVVFSKACSILTSSGLALSFQETLSTELSLYTSISPNWTDHSNQDHFKVFVGPRHFNIFTHFLLLVIIL